MEKLKVGDHVIVKTPGLAPSRLDFHKKFVGRKGLVVYVKEYPADKRPIQGIGIVIDCPPEREAIILTKFAEIAHTFHPFEKQAQEIVDDILSTGFSYYTGWEFEKC